MARALRVEYPGAIYHVCSRMLGDARGRLFRNDGDRERYMRQLAERVDTHGIRLYMYVLMSNHVHLVFETPNANCSRFMQSLNTAYTVYFNRRHGRHGHLLDGRFKAKLVEPGEGDGYLLALSRYVHLNPICIRAVESATSAERRKILRAYVWSSYRAYAGLSKPSELLSRTPILDLVSRPGTSSERAYRSYVEQGIGAPDNDFRESYQASPQVLGGPEFQAWAELQLTKSALQQPHPEDHRFRHTRTPLDAQEVLAVLAQVLGVDVAEFRVRRRGSSLRGIASLCLVRFGHLNQREIAKVLGVRSGAAVGHQLKRVRQEMEVEPTLRRQYRAAVDGLLDARRA